MKMLLKNKAEPKKLAEPSIIEEFNILRVDIPELEENVNESLHISAIVKELCEDSPQKESVSEEDIELSQDLDKEMEKIEHSINKSARMQTE